MPNAINATTQAQARALVDPLTPLVMQRVYADGAWVPAITTTGGSVTHSVQRGTFERIGGMIHFTAEITLSGISTPAGDVQISGLPLPAAEGGGAWVATMSNVTLTAGYTFLTGRIVAGESTVRLYQQGSGVAELALPGTALSASTVLRVAGVYGASEVAAAAVSDAILALGPIAYWPLNETSGTTAIDYSGNGYNGTYSGSTLATILSPFVAPSFTTGTTQHADMYSAGLAGTFGASEGSVLLFFRPLDLSSGVRQILYLANASGEIVRISHGGDSLIVRRDDDAGGFQQVTAGALSPASWVMATVTWSVADDEFAGYLNTTMMGAGVPVTGVGSWTDTLSTAIISGQATTGTTARVSGNVAHVALFDYPLTSAEIAAVYAAAAF